MFFVLFWTCSIGQAQVRVQCGSNGQVSQVQAGSLTTPLANIPDSIDVPHNPRDLAHYLCQQVYGCEKRGNLGSAARDLYKGLQWLNGSKASSVEQCLSEAYRFAEDMESVNINRNAGINRNKNGDYSISRLTKIAEIAIQEGVDPYLAMAVGVIETPPLVLKNDDKYQNDYGLVPVDQIGAYSELGCLPEGKFVAKILSQADVQSLQAESAKLKPLNQASNDLTKSYWKKDPALENLVAALTFPSVFAHGARGQLPIYDYATLLTKLAQQDRAKIEALPPATQKDLANYVAVYNRSLEQQNRLAEAKASIRDRHPNEEQGVATEMECLADPTQCEGIVRSPAEVQQFDLSSLSGVEPASVSKFQFCAIDSVVKVAKQPTFLLNQSGGCCASVKASGTDLETEKYLKTALGARYLKGEIQSCVAEGAHPISYCLQKYNGLGCFGCAEKMKNDCFANLQMATHPIYGARVADMALAGLMANDVINKIVAKAAKQIGKPVMSMFCLRSPAGTKTLDSNQFLVEQHKILAGRPACNGLL